MSFEEILSDSNTIYHYTSLGSALEKILPLGELRFSSFQHTNDPLVLRRPLFLR
jgi:hypothetical protein